MKEAKSDRLSGVKTLQVGNFLDEFEKDDIKRKVDIVGLFSRFDVKLEKKGKGYMGLCPFHDDSTPSLSVDREKGLFHCFGCGESGDVFDLVMKLKGFSFPDALKYLKNGSSLDLAASVTGMKKPEEAEPPGVKRAEEPAKESIEHSVPAFPSVSPDSIADYYHGRLSESAEAVEYLTGRGLWKPEVLKRFRVGFSSGDLKGKLSSLQKSALKESGVLNSGGTEHLKGCITVPLTDEAGVTVGFYGRKIDGKASVKHLYLKGPHRGVMNREAASVYRERVILTESVLDALSLVVSGVENVIPCYGTNGFTDEHLNLLKDNRVKEIVIAFDNDEAGREGAEKLKGTLLQEGFPVRLLFPPENLKDWNDALMQEFTRERFDELLSESSLCEPEGKERLWVEVKGGKYEVEAGSLVYRIVGVKEGFISSLKVNIRAEREGEKHIDNVDLFSARSRSSYALQLSRILGVEAVRVENDLVSILEWLEEERDRKLLGVEESGPVTLTPEEETAGRELLEDPALCDRIEEDLTNMGYVGERTNKLLMYLAASSRKLDDPVSVIVIAQSAAGKSYLIDTVKKLIPPEDVLSMTSLSDQALNYLPDDALLHKFLSLGEAVHSDVIDHQMREMLSGQELSRLVTVKDEKSGRMTSRLVRKKVIVSAVMSSTSHDINPENASRCFVISTDESEEQTKAIHREQRKKYTLDRIQNDEEAEKIITRHHAAQRLLKPLLIVNPFADLLDFPSQMMRSRRDHERFIDLIACVCFLRQCQKEQKREGDTVYIECDLADYTTAHELMLSILPTTVSTFPAGARLLYDRIRELLNIKAEEESLQLHEVSITQREIRERAGLEHNFVKRNMRLLVEYEYVLQKGGHYRGGRAAYRLNQDGPPSFEEVMTIPSPEDIGKRIKSGSEVGHTKEKS